MANRQSLVTRVRIAQLATFRFCGLDFYSGGIESVYIGATDYSLDIA
jgi:hypothetical protein